MPTENDACRAWLKWMALQYPVQYNHIIKIDNEGVSNRANAVSLGLHVGASDYFLAWPTISKYGCWIEAKREGWKLTKSNELHTERQLMFGKKMIERGYAFYFCVGFDEMMQATDEYLNAR
jgi:hypothetical protein